jgi:integrase
MKSHKKQPVEIVTEKGQSIPIYFTPDRKAGKEYPSFTFAYIQTGRRKRARASSLPAAIESAKAIARQLAEGPGHVHSLTPQEVADFAVAKRTLRQMPSISLEEAVAGFVRASAMLPTGKTLEDAVALLRANVEANAKITSATVAEVVASFITSREKNGSSDRYLRDCRNRLGKLRDAFRCPISSITSSDLSAWLDGMNVGNRSRSNYRNAVVTLFSFAKKRGHLPRETRTEAELVERPRPAISPVGIYTSSQLQNMLSSMTGQLRAAVAIQAFAGVRTAEIFRLEWKDVDRRGGFLIVAAEKSKTASRRLVPILPALAAWLDTCPVTDGRILSFSHPTAFNRSMARALKRAKIDRVDNGLRHSFASYRLAAVKSADQVALEMGNSPRKLFSNYRELVTEAEAEKWFAVRPAAGSTNIIPMSAAAA